ncbi:MAG: hypothetical protein RJA26_417 [Actinomycetota bacterium]|jgi:Zn-dependent protease with chaperone function
MLAYGALLGLSLFWLLTSGLLGSKILLRLTPKSHPRIRLILWMGGLYSLMFSGLTAIMSTAVILSTSWLGLEKVSAGLDNIGYVLLVSVLPWAGLALFAGLIGLIITRFEPARQAARQTNELLSLAGKPAQDFQGLPVRVLDAGYLAAALIESSKKPMILITEEVRRRLEPREFHAVLWHEVGHAIGQHNGLNRLARVAAAFAPRLPLCRDIANAVESACEELADDFALRHVEPRDLAAAKSKFAF